MDIAKIENGNIVAVDNYRKMFPNVSFPASGPNDGFLESNSCKRVKVRETIDKATQKIVPADPYIDGEWVKTYTVVNLTQEEKDELSNQQTEIKEKSVRDQRDRLLAETDYLALSDNTLTTEMTTYRQALRDITSHANYPNLGVDDWPTKPE